MLVTVVQRALNQNLDLDAALARVRQTRAAASGAGAELLPTADLGASATFEHQSLRGEFGSVAAGLYGAFPVKGLFPRWLGSRSADCSLGFAHSSLFGAGKAVLRPVACDQVPGARGRGQGTETLAQLGGLPP